MGSRIVRLLHQLPPRAPSPVDHFGPAPQKADRPEEAMQPVENGRCPGIHINTGTLLATPYKTL